MTEKISFGRWLRQRRRLLDLTQQAFADLVGCSRSTLRRIEADNLKPSRELALILLEKLDIPEAERLEWLRFARGLSTTPQKSAQGYSPFRRSTNLPTTLTSFIGRENAQDEIVNLIAKNRLVTITGAGGIGKTRLSFQLGQKSLNDYPDGVWFVAFDSLSEPSLVTQTVASVFDIREGSDRPVIEILKSFLRQKAMLLILDNCDHLLDACTQLTKTLLTDCPNLKILATSREILNMEGEATYYLPSLSISESDSALPEKLYEFESVQLFEERAALALSSFRLTKQNTKSVSHICRRVDGIPLAIELAAAHVDILQVNEILEQLNHCFDMLVNRSRTALPRHQTMRASMDWSWGLLTPIEQAFMRQLSVFAGGWTLESAQAVCDVHALNLISALAKKSLIIVDHEAGHKTRYHFHEIVRQYAHEKLVPSGEEKDIRTRHLQYFLQLSEEAEPGLRGPTQTEWLSRLNDERDNIRAALRWADQTNVEAGLYVLGRLWRYWERSEMREVARWLATFIENPESKAFPHARAKALHTQGWVLIWIQQFVQARLAAEECLDLFKRYGDHTGEIDGLVLLGYSSDNNQRMELCQQALVLAEALGDIWRQAYALRNLSWTFSGDKRFTYAEKAIMLFRQCGDWGLLVTLLSKFGYYAMLNGDIKLAQQRLDEALRLSDQLNDKDAKSVLLQSLGEMSFRKGDYSKAHEYYQDALGNWEELGTRMDVLWCRAHLGYIALRESKINEAQNILADVVQNFQKDGSEIGVAFSFEGMAGLCIAVDKPSIAARLIGLADATREKISNTRPRLEQADVDKDIAACLAKMGEVAFSDEYDEGKKMTLDDAVALVLG